MSITLRAIAAIGAVAVAALLAGCQSTPATPANNPPAPQPPPPPIKQPEVSPKERANLHADLGAGYYERGQMDVALQELDEAAKLDPNNPRVYNISGLVYAMLGENGKAEQSFQRALALAPQDSDIHHNWGWFLCNTGKPREAILEFEQALRNPLYRTPDIAMVNAGRCSMAFGDAATAETYFKRAQAFAPNNVGANYGLALIAYRAGRQDEARIAMKRLMQQPSPSPEVLYLGMCVERKGGDRIAENSYVAQLRNRYPDSFETKAIATGSCD
jgi:type IV pilus assembly protein PilF